MRRITVILLSFGLIAALAFALDSRRSLRVPLVNADGNRVGIVTLRPARNQGTFIEASVWGLTPGFHGFHVHEHGRCEVTDEGTFITAGGHFDRQPEHHHGDHAGDMPILLLDSTGRAVMSFYTGGFTMRDLLADDGTAIIIHADADNFANIPARYGGPDATTLANGDAGARIACGVIKR